MTLHLVLKSDKLLPIKFAQKLILKARVHRWVVNMRESWLLSWSRTSSGAHARH